MSIKNSSYVEFEVKGNIFHMGFYISFVEVLVLIGGQNKTKLYKLVLLQVLLKV